MLHLLLLVASLTAYLDGDVSTVYVLKTNESIVQIPMIDGEVDYAISDQGDIEYEVQDGMLILHGNNQSFYIIKLTRPSLNKGNVREFTFYNPGFDITEFKVYLPDNSTLINAYPETYSSVNPIRWHENSSIYAVKYSVNTHDEYDFQLIMFALIIFLAVIYFIHRRYVHFRIAKEIFEKQIAGLSEYEKDVLRAIFETPGIRQRDVAVKLNLNKSHLSKLLGRMEARYLVRRERYGRVIKLYLGEYFKGE